MKCQKRKKHTSVDNWKTSSNSNHKARDKCSKKTSLLKFDASNKRRDADTDSDKTEQFAKITAMQSSNESLKLVS
jgi:hypothetical protein